MDIPDTGYQFADAEKLAKIAKSRLRVSETTIEYLFYRDQLDNDELSYSKAIFNAWAELKPKQREILFLRLVQGYSFRYIGDINGFSRNNASKIFYNSCKKIQKYFKK
jgi:DNA-directed RNA polymerase specialized sigma24 family protein